jgi:hypothetical protein
LLCHINIIDIDNGIIGIGSNVDIGVVNIVIVSFQIAGVGS